MKQDNGYAILLKSDIALNNYLTYGFAVKNTDIIKKLRESFNCINPYNYRGISRDILIPHVSLSSLSPKIAQILRTHGTDIDINQKARIKLSKYTKKYQDAEDYDTDILENLEQAKEVYALLDQKDNYEIVHLKRFLQDKNSNTLGFDIGYWGGDHFSLICDVAVMPMWHGPLEEDYDEIVPWLKLLNSNVLFDNYNDAQHFKVYYKTKKWAEHEYQDNFNIIRINTIL